MTSTVCAIDAQGLSSEAHAQTSSARHWHLIAQVSVLYRSHRKAKGLRPEFWQAKDVPCGHCIHRASTYRLWNEAMGCWKPRAGTDIPGYTTQCVFISCQDLSRRSARTRVCQTSFRPKHVNRSPPQTSTSHPHLNRGRPRDTCGRSRGICGDGLASRHAPTYIRPTEPAPTPPLYPRPLARRGMRMGRLPRPPHPPAQPRKTQTKSAFPPPPPPPAPPRRCSPAPTEPRSLRAGARRPPRPPGRRWRREGMGVESAPRLRRQGGLAPPARRTLSRRARAPRRDAPRR
ncbi:hypothetical protein BC826DRAFT_1031439, partial [Russula brevipes]